MAACASSPTMSLTSNDADLTPPVAAGHRSCSSAHACSRPERCLVSDLGLTGSMKVVRPVRGHPGLVLDPADGVRRSADFLPRPRDGSYVSPDRWLPPGHGHQAFVQREQGRQPAGRVVHHPNTQGQHQGDVRPLFLLAVPRGAPRRRPVVAGLVGLVLDRCSPAARSAGCCRSTVDAGGRPGHVPGHSHPRPPGARSRRAFAASVVLVAGTVALLTSDLQSSTGSSATAGQTGRGRQRHPRQQSRWSSGSTVLVVGQGSNTSPRRLPLFGGAPVTPRAQLRRTQHAPRDATRPGSRRCPAW